MIILLFRLIFFNLLNFVFAANTESLQIAIADAIIFWLPAFQGPEASAQLRWLVLQLEGTVAKKHLYPLVPYLYHVPPVPPLPPGFYSPATKIT